MMDFALRRVKQARAVGAARVGYWEPGMTQGKRHGDPGHRPATQDATSMESGQPTARVIAVDRARRLGYRRMFLDSLPTMLEARSLYASLGFSPCVPYYDNRALGGDCFVLVL